ncbi:MAG: methionine--tRNA ligase [Gammaproteobacteria bacterium]|nr:methionine--tRNA ligase [Gammaproteobacteria bacterium]
MILVTSALPYANGSIHLGHMLEYIQTDIWVRYQKQCGHQCVYVCADDAHGTAIMLRAQTLGITPEELISDVKSEHEADFSGFHIDFDHYSSTHTETNRHFSELIYSRVRDAGGIAVRNISQLFDPDTELFLADRYVKGTCPKCSADDQYGDNCEACGATYHASELRNPKSTLSGAVPVLKDTEHLFFELDQHTEFLKDWTRSGRLQLEVTNKLAEWIEGGLKSWDISRDAPYFGFEVPDRPGTYFYVWLDAPIGYMGAFKEWCDTNNFDFDSVWGPESVAEIYHFIGKDIVNFHCLFWPAILNQANYRTPTGVNVHGFVTIDGRKMSKSRGTFIKARTYLDHLDPEYLRYYFATKLSANVEDIDLSLEDFAQKVNSDLVGKLVNIASRTAGFITKKFDGQLSADLANPDLVEAIRAKGPYIQSAFEMREFSKAAREIMALADDVNAWIADVAPWHLAKSEDTLAEVQPICTTAINAFRILVLYLKPVTPMLAGKVQEFLQVDSLDYETLNDTLLDHSIAPFTPLLTRIEMKDVEAMIQPDVNEIDNPSKSEIATNNEPIAPECTIDDFTKVDLRVVTIVAAEAVEGADKLLRLTLDLDGETRQVFSAIKAAYKAEDLIGRQTVMIANLAPRKMKFGVSEGMILAAGPGGADIYLLEPDRGAKAGQRIR